jgi:hypothetical protein
MRQVADLADQYHKILQTMPPTHAGAGLPPLPLQMPMQMLQQFGVAPAALGLGPLPSPLPNANATANGHVAPAVAAAPGPGRKRKTADTAADPEADADGEAGDGKRRRRKKKERDPDLPKRPPSAYLFYQNDVRQEMKEQNSFTPHHELLGIIAKQWATLSPEKRKPYEDKQKAAKGTWESEMGLYNTRHGITPKVGCVFLCFYW